MMFGLTPYRKRNNWLDGRDGWNPWDEVNRAFEELFNGAWPAPFFRPDGGMRVDIRETDKEYVVEAEIPGANKKDIQLDIQDGVLTIAVKRDEQVDVERDNYIRRERRFTGMKRSFRLDNVKEEDVKAAYKDGILTITLPKRTPGRKGRSIEID
jgi:HSP20 family protein